MNRVIRINGEAAEPLTGATIIETEPGVFSILTDGSSYEARVSGSEVTINGLRYQYEIEDPREWKRSGSDADARGKASILAPMPGKIVRIIAAVGDDVKAGQGIVVVEAMKMQNEMKAPRDGKVTSIAVRENDSVIAGAVLAVIE
jgi:biotin carboxyl carrier protein